MNLRDLRPSDLLPAAIAFLALALTVRIAAALAGLLPPVNAQLPVLPDDALLARSLLHVAYGFAGFAIVLVSGIALLSMPGLKERLSKTDVLAFAIPAGIGLCLVLSLLTAMVPAGGIVSALALVVVVAARLVPAWRTLRTIPISLADAALVAIATATAAAHSAIMWRPPGNGFGGTLDPGDLAHYIGRFHTLERQTYPFFNLSSEGELITTYFNHLHSFLAMSVSWLPGFEIGLLLATGLVVFYALSVAFSLAILVMARRQDGMEMPSGTTMALICLLMVASVQYPTWVVESPPVAFLSAFTFTLLYAVHRAGTRPIALTATLGLALLGSVLTKVVSIAVLAGYSGACLLVRCFRQLSRAQLVLLSLAGLIVAGYVAYMLMTYGPYFLPLIDFGPESWLRFEKKGWERFGSVIPYLLRDTGLVLIAIGTLWLRDPALALTVIVGVVLQFSASFLFHATPMAAIILVAGTLVLKARPPRPAFWTMLLGCLMIIEYHLDEDHGEWHLGLIWTLAIGSVVWLTLRSAAATAAGSDLRRPGQYRIAWLSLCLLAGVSVIGAASGAMRLGDDDRVIVQPDLIDIWERTRELVPQDGLVFTDQVGFGDHSLSGLNDLSLVAQRQLYIGSFSVSALRHDANARRQRLGRNSAVLDGSLQPDELALSRRYDGFYAVLSLAHATPHGFEPLYRNEGYALYRIAGDPPAR